MFSTTCIISMMRNDRKHKYIFLSPKLIQQQQQSYFTVKAAQSPLSPTATPCRPRINSCWADFNTLRPRQNGRHFPDDIFEYIFLNVKVLILIKISLKFVPKCSINNIPALVQIMAWRLPGDKPLSEPMMVSFPTHICVTRPQ